MEQDQGEDHEHEDHHQRWLSAGKAIAGNLGTVVVGTTWPVEADNGTQATAVQRRLGGTID